MDLLLILTYTGLCIVIFKVFKIPLNKWSVPTAILGGIVIIGGLVFTMNYNHPFSEISREYFVTTPIVPTVTGKVIEVPVTGNQKLTKGDILFKVDPVPFENKLKGLVAQMVSAQSDFDRASKLRKTGAGSQRNVDLTRAQVEALDAQIAIAQYNVEQTVVRAPTDGYATQVTLRPGMMATNIPLRPVMIFVHDEGSYLVGWYRQNSALRLQAGNEAEVAYDGIPGKVFSAEVVMMAPGIAEGQLQPTPTLIDPRQNRYPGRIAVVIHVTDEDFEPYRGKLPGGAFAQTAIYSEHVHHVAIMRKVLLRMASWMNYLFPFH